MKRPRLWVALAASLLAYACQRTATERDEPSAPTAGEAGALNEIGGAGGDRSDEVPTQAGQPESAGGASRAGNSTGGAPTPSNGGAGSGGDNTAAGGPPTTKLVCHDGSRGEGATCDSFCEAWFPICKTHPTTAAVFADAADCQAQCAMFTEEQLCCRGYHVTNAPDNPNTHCAHSAGIRTCP